VSALQRLGFSELSEQGLAADTALDHKGEDDTFVWHSSGDKSSEIRHGSL
jgi:hypothetical protein